MNDDNPFDDSSSDEDDGFYSYKKKEFHKKGNGGETKTTSTSEDALLLFPSPPKRARRTKHGATSTDDALSKLERRREKHSAKQAVCFDLAQGDNDDDSDVEAEKAAAMAKVAEASTANHINKGQKPVELLDSSDEEEGTSLAETRAPSFHRHAPIATMARSGMRKESCEKLAQARHAMYKLQQAQRYHGEDVYIPAPRAEPVVVNLDSSSPTQSQSAQQQQQPRRTSSATTNLGPSILLQLRTTQVVNGVRSDLATTETMSIQKMEPFQKLLDRYQTKHKIVPSECSVKFSLDGSKVDLLKTPASYDLEDDDLIEVLTTSLVVRTAASTTASAAAAATSSNSAATTAPANAGAHFGPPVQLKLRTQENNGNLVHDVLTIRRKEPLQKLMDKYKKQKNLAANARVSFVFDGETMHMTKTPAFYDMESEDIVEVVHK